MKQIIFTKEINMERKSHDIIQEYDKKQKLFESFSYKIKQLLEEMIYSENISCNITCRLKERESLIKKIEVKQEKYNSLDEITDIAGVRIITYYSDDVDKIIDLVEKEFNVDKENSIDKRKALEPDRFGYCSVHYIIGISDERLKLREYRIYKGLKCEVQIRTVLQHAWAEIEHDLGYKSEITIPKEIRRNFSRLAGLLEIGDKEFLEIRNFLNTYKADVAEKISDSDLDEKGLDAIILNELIDTNPQIIAMNKKLEVISGNKVTNNPVNFDHYFKRFKWLGISTLGQLRNIITKNESIALEIAKEVFKISKPTEGAIIDKGISLFYICYAELLYKYHDFDSIYRYLKETNIQSTEKFAQNLLEIQKSLGL